MDLVRTLGVAIDPTGAKTGGAAAASAFLVVSTAATKSEKAATGAQKQIDAAGKAMGTTKRASDSLRDSVEGQARALQRLALMASSARSELLRLVQASALIGPLALPGGSGGGDRNIINVTGTAGGPQSPQLLLQTSNAARTAAESLHLLSSKGRLAAGMWNLMATGAGRARSAMASVASMARSGAAQYGVIGGVAGAALLTNGILDSATTQDRVRNMLRYSTKSDQVAEREINFVKDATRRLGLEFETTSLAYAKFLTVGRTSKLSFLEIRDAFEGVASAAAVMGLSAEDSRGVFLALTQMMSKGKVTAEELRGQLAERLDGGIQHMANALGVTTQQLDKMVERGDLIATNVLPKFGRELKKQFGPEAARNATSTTGAINELKNAWTEFKLELIDAGIVEVLKKIMQAVVVAVREVGNFISNVRKAFGELKAALSNWGDGPIVKAIAAFGSLSLGIADTAEGIFKNGLGKQKAIGSFALPASENPVKLDPFLTRPTRTQDYFAGFKNTAEDFTRLGTYSRYDSVSGNIEKHMGQLERAGEETTKALASNFTDFWGDLVSEGGRATDKLRNMFASLAKDIARIFAQRTIAEPIAGALAMLASGLFGGGGGAGAAAGSAAGGGSSFGFQSMSVPIMHGGGLVGSASSLSRMVGGGLFFGAPRLHSGLAPDEFPAILQRGEEVVPKGQAGQRGGLVINTTINVDGSRGGTPEQNRELGAEIARQYEAMIDQRIARAMLPRGVIRGAFA